MWHQVFIATRFKEWQVRDKQVHMKCVKEYLQTTRNYFDHLIDSETYYAMADEAYAQYEALIDKANQEDFILLDLSPDLDFDLYAAMPMDDPFMCEEVLLL